MEGSTTAPERSQGPLKTDTQNDSEPSEYRFAVLLTNHVGNALVGTLRSYRKGETGKWVTTVFSEEVQIDPRHYSSEYAARTGHIEMLSHLRRRFEELGLPSDMRLASDAEFLERMGML